MAKYNRVPSGQAGTGEAFILPESKALQGLIDNVDYNRKMGLLNVKARNDYQNKVNKDYMDNQLKVKSGILYQDELNNAAQQWTDKGAQYRAQGFNVYNPNPNNPQEVAAASEFMKEKAQIEGMSQTRDLYQKNFTDQQAAYQKGGFDDDSYAAFQDFYKTNKLADLYQGGVTPPTLMKQFDTQGFMKNIAAPTITQKGLPVNGIETTTVAPNSAAIRMNVEDAVKATPQAQRWFNKQFGINETETPAKILIGSVDPVEVSGYLDQYYQTDPAGIQEAVKAFPAGTVPSYNSPEFKKFRDQAVAKQLAEESKYERGIQSLAKTKENQVNTKNQSDYDFALENQQMKREDQSMQRRRFGWAAEDQANKRTDRKLKDAALNKRDEFIQGLQVGNTEQVQNLRQLAKAKGGTVRFLPNGMMRVQYKPSASADLKTQDIDLSEINDNGYVAINELLNDVAGSKVALEKLQAKPAYSGGLVDIGNSSVTQDQIKYLRDKYKGRPQDLGDLFLGDKEAFSGFKNRTEAYKIAAEILDQKGRFHKIEQKK